MINLGSNGIANLKLGSQSVQNVYLGAQLVWPPPSSSSSYFQDMGVQMFGWESEFYVPWWGN